MSEWHLVYQGGHHNVYCDGERHIHTSGGYCHEKVDIWDEIGIALRRNKKVGCRPVSKCDCYKYAPPQSKP